MQIEPFSLERYFARYEFSAEYLLSPSDCESLSMGDLLAMADMEVQALWRELRLGYTESSGHPLLREEIARQYPGISRDQVITAAPEEAIFLAMNTLLRPGDRLVTVWPAYQSLHSLARAIGCEVVAWPVELKDGRWSVDLDRLAELLPGARMLILNFPHNPTGYLPPAEIFEQAISMAERAGAWVFSDEMYRMLELDPADRLPSACTLTPRAITLSGLSKAHGLAGLRTGWLAVQDHALVADFQALKDYTTICSSAPGELLSIAGLRAQDELVKRSLATIRRNLDTARSFFGDRSEAFEWIDPRGGSIAFPLWKGQASVEAFCAYALDRAGVMIVPGSMFQHPGRHFRVGLGRINLPTVLERVDSCLSGIV